MRVLIVGCSNRGYPFLSKKDLKNVFDKTFSFGYLFILIESNYRKIKLKKNYMGI